MPPRVFNRRTNMLCTGNISALKSARSPQKESTLLLHGPDAAAQTRFTPTHTTVQVWQIGTDNLATDDWRRQNRKDTVGRSDWFRQKAALAQKLTTMLVKIPCCVVLYLKSSLS